MTAARAASRAGPVSSVWEETGPAASRQSANAVDVIFTAFDSSPRILPRMNMRTLSVLAGLFLTSVHIAGQAPAAAPAGRGAGTCESLASLALPHTTITLAQLVAPGAFTPPAGRQGRGALAYSSMPAFCRVAATLAPSSDSDIKVE